jgi:hypothetical protein
MTAFPIYRDIDGEYFRKIEVSLYFKMIERQRLFMLSELNLKNKG